jgi:hypothetical protein
VTLLSASCMMAFALQLAIATGFVSTEAGVKGTL